jgi:hypothetical protein
LILCAHALIVEEDSTETNTSQVFIFTCLEL